MKCQELSSKNVSQNLLQCQKGAELSEVMQIYKEKWQFPICAGATDGIHIPIIAPAADHSDYVNRKGYHSIIMKAVVDSKYLFKGCRGRVA